MKKIYKTPAQSLINYELSLPLAFSTSAGGTGYDDVILGSNQKRFGDVPWDTKDDDFTSECSGYDEW